MRAIALLTFLACSAFRPGPALAQPAAPSAEQQLVRRWLDRWNAIGNGPSAVDALVELYAPDALHTTGPTPDQRGTATYRGNDGIRALAGKVVATQDRLAWRLEAETANEQTATLFHAAAGPWGGPSVGVQLVAVYTDRASGTRYVVPGAAFFQLQGDKIRRLRVYLADGERVAVEAERKRPY